MITLVIVKCHLISLINQINFRSYNYNFDDFFEIALNSVHNI